MNRTKKILSLLLTVLLLAGTLAPLSYADSEEVVPSEENEVSSEVPVVEEEQEESTQEVEETIIPENQDDVIAPRSIIQPVAKTHTYRFLTGSIPEDPNEDALHHIQQVKNGEFVFEPAIPVVDGKIFEGWYGLKADNTLVDEQFDFSKPITVVEDKTINIYAKFKDKFFVRFIYDGRVLATKEVDPNDKVTPDGVPLTITDENTIFDYWQKEGEVGPFDFNTPITENMTLQAITKEGVTITFDTRGGSAVLPAYRAKGELLGAIVPPVKQGHSFDGWEDSDGNIYNADTVVASSLTLYAKWVKANVNYVVAHLQENANDNGYSFIESETKTGLPEDPANWTSKDYDGFEKGTVAEEKTINADGSTIVEVKYKRKVYTFTIRRLKSDGTWETLSTTELKYGQSTAEPYNRAVADWPKYLWYTTPSGNVAYSESPAMPNKALTVYGRYAGDRFKYTIRYIEKGINPEKQIKDDYVFTSNRKLIFTDEDGINIAGFTVTPRAQWGNLTPNQISRIPYTRNNYKITFHKNDGTGTMISDAIPYEADISDQDPAGWDGNRTKKIDGILYYFSGWYTEPIFSNIFEFDGETMPAYSFELYAKWTSEKYKVLLHENLHIDSPIYASIVDIPPLTTISEQGAPSNPDAFVGWFWYRDGQFVPFDFDTPISENLDLYPVWEDQVAQIEYDVNGGEGDAPEDLNHYLIGTNAIVMTDNDIFKVGERFIGWNTKKDGTGDKYLPGNSILIDEDITLYAQWGPIDFLAELTYKSNGGIEGDKIYLILNNDKHSIREGSIFTRPGYEFVAWNSQADGKGKNYHPGDEVTIDNFNQDTENILYAQWKRVTIPVEATKVWVNGPSDRPEVILELWRKNGTAGAGEKVAEKTVDKESGKADFGEQPKTDENGVDYEYYVLEPKVPENYQKVEEGLKVTNSYQIPKGNIDVIKKWVGGPEDKPVIKLQLTRDGKDFGPVVELKGKTTHSWKDLDITDINGKRYVYKVKEVDVPENYKLSYGEDGKTIINTWIAPEEPKKPEKPKLPETGSVNLTWMLFAGLALFGGGATLTRKMK